MELGRLAVLTAVAAAVVLPARLWVAEPIYVATGSMAPTLPVGRHLIADKLTLRLRDLRRGDIVVLLSPVPGEGDFIKRVIGLPGDTVELREKKVFVNGTELDEPYAVHDRPNDRLLGDTLGPLSVPPDGLFVLGDNRDESEDSTVWKDEAGNPLYFVPRRNVRGLVRGIY